MKLWFTSFTGHYHGTRRLLLGAAIMIFLGFVPPAGAQGGIPSKLAAGEIVVSTQDVPGSSLKRAEMTGIIDAPPEVVWQIITDVNNFKFFMPRTLNSMAVAAEKIPAIVQQRPSKAEEVEKLLGPTPANPASSRVPGGKYTVYLYSNLEFPWPCSNRWYIVKGQQDETQAAQQQYRSSWSLVIGNLLANSGPILPCPK
jgi:hypothetical protein